MKTTTYLVPLQTVQPTASVSESFSVPDGAEVTVAVHMKTGSVGPTAPLSVLVSQSFDEAPSLWFEFGRIDSPTEPLSTAARVLKPDALTRHIRVAALGSKGAPVELAVLVTTGEA